jgi:hypothetical protein
MKDENQLESAVHDLIVDVCEVLYQHGYRTVNIGAIMRLIGVDNKAASGHDQDLFKLDEEFEELIKKKQPKIAREDIKVPRGATLH